MKSVKHAVIKHDDTGKKMISIVESFGKFKEHLKILHNEVDYVEKITERELRKGAEYPNDRIYILFEDPLATMFHKVERAPGIMPWSSTASRLNKLCEWELIKLDLIDENRNKNKMNRSKNDKSSTVSPHPLRNFNLNNYSSGSMCIVYKDYNSCVNAVCELTNKLFNKLNKDPSKTINERIVVSNNNIWDTKELKRYGEFDMKKLYKEITAQDKVFLIIDYDKMACAKVSDRDNLLKMVQESSKSDVILVMLVNAMNDTCHDIVKKSNHVTLLKEISTPNLNELYSIIDTKNWFSDKLCFRKTYEQLTNERYGAMIISPNEDTPNVISWYRITL